MTNVAPQANPTPAKMDTPGAVTIVALLALIVGFFGIIGGILLFIAGLTNPASVAGGQSGLVLALQGVVYFVIGLAALTTFKALRQGQHWARLVFTIVLVVGLVLNVLNLFIGNGFSTAIWGVIVDIAALIVLWGIQSSRTFFDAHRS